MEFANDEAERLNSHLDVQARDRSAKPDGLDPELVAIYEQMAALNARSTPHPTLKADIWRTMMITPQAAVSFTARTVNSRRGKGTASRAKADRWRHSQRFLNAFATLALIAAVAFSGYLFVRPTDEPGFNAGDPALRTPAAAATPSMCSSDPTAKYFITNIGGAAFSPKLNSDPSKDVNFWALQGWRVAAGATADYTGASPSNATDFVLSGFYEATFGSAATVARLIEPGWNAPSPTGGVVQPGVTIDLTYGDSVSFDPSKGVKIVNLSASVDIVFKRALFTTDDPSAAPAANGASAVIDAKGKLSPEILAKDLEPNVMGLQFVPYGRQVPCDYAKPLGPPAGALASGPMAGYFLTVGFGG